MSWHIKYSSLGIEYFMTKILLKALNLVYLTSHENIILFLNKFVIVKLMSYCLLEKSHLL